MELGKRLTDENKKEIIESIKRELEKSVKHFKAHPNERRGNPMIRFSKSQLNEMDKAWLEAMYGHFGVRVTFDL